MRRSTLWSAWRFYNGPNIYNIFLSDLFLIIKDTDFASCADDNTIYKTNNNINDVIAYYSSQPN